MKFFTATFLTAILAFIIGLFLPWWGIAIAALVVAVIVHQKAGRAFLAGYTGVFVLWVGLSLWINMKNTGILSKKIANILPLNGNIFLLIAITGLIGGLVAGLAAMSGSYLRSSAR